MKDLGEVVMAFVLVVAVLAALAVGGIGYVLGRRSGAAELRDAKAAHAVDLDCCADFNAEFLRVSAHHLCGKDGGR